MHRLPSGCRARGPRGRPGGTDHRPVGLSERVDRLMSDRTTVLETNARDRLRELTGRISGVSTLPAVAVRIMEVVNDVRAGASDLKGVVEQDPALTARILKTVNSAYCGLRTKIGSLQHAISLLGFNVVRNLAITLSVSDIFKLESEVPNYSRLDLWTHMLSVALGSKMIARRIGNAEYEEAFLAGLLHDIGIVMLDEHAHGEFCLALAAVGPDRELRSCEHQVLGFDHAAVGAAVADLWRFPEVVVERIRWHHEPHRSSTENRVMVSVVALANFLCNQKGFSAVKVKHAPTIRAELLADLGLDRDDLRVLWEDMDQELTSARELFRL